MIGKLVLGLWIAQLSCLIVNDVGATDDSIRLVDESLDERNDPEIFRAVVQSMNEWERKRRNHRSKREVSRVCYEDVGCFEDTGPFSYLEMLPSPPKDVGTRFFVYGSRKARSVPMEVPAENISDKASNVIDPTLPTKVIVHGFGSSCDHIWVYEMRSALMAVIECNLVCVDWGPGSAVPNYVRAAANTRLVGRQLAKLVRSLNVPLEKVHLIGFSLGAHVAGFAGAELGNVSRITGLDPAGPLFEAQDPRARLDETDAQYVDVIHSNGEQLILGGLGSWQPMGTVDFYPNGGRMQSGCSNLFVGAVSDIIWSSPVEGRSLCNHRRAYKLFTDSISPKCRFPAFPCESGYEGLLRGECFPCGSKPDAPCGSMGFYSDKHPARGQLYLVTRDEEPFCAHQYQVKVYNSKHERPVKSYGRLQVTLVADSLYNETFTMTKKDDEELLVGATLQKIVVPHPTLSNIDAIEIKYTAYSGWISSGLVSWSVDKVSVVDSYGATFSMCKRGLILESGRPVYLPLYPGECNVPPETEETTTPSSSRTTPPPSHEEFPTPEEPPKPAIGIGPFTKDQNYDRNGGKDSFSNEVPQKGLGPFTKEENLKIAKEHEALLAAAKEYADNSSAQKNYQLVSSWPTSELSNDASSNSLDSSEYAERGRGFSGPSLSLDRSGSSQPAPADGPGRPPVAAKKETGRALRLPEITEPVLRPRATRQEQQQQQQQQSEERKHEVLEEAPSSRGFTVQFLPERLAGILAQAERYARQTLLPLISQYTPSFIGGGRTERPKYFPPLGNLFGSHEEEESSERKRIGESNDSRTKYFIEFEEEVTSTTTTSTSTSTLRGVTETSVVTKVERNQRVLAVTPDREKWVPVAVKPLQSGNERKEKALEGEWLSEGGSSWSPRPNETDSLVPETKIDDWVPLASSSNSTSDSRKFIPLAEAAPTTTAGAPAEQPKSEAPPATPQLRSIVFPYVYERKNDPRTRYIPLIPEEDLGVSSLAKEKER